MVESGRDGRRQRLAAGNQSPPSPASIHPSLIRILSIRAIRLVVLDIRLNNLLNISNLNENVLGFEIRVNDAAFPVEVVEAEENLLRDLLDEMHWDTPVLPALDQTQKVLAEDLKHHAYVLSIRARMLERVEERYDVRPTRVIRVRLHNLLKQLYLVEGGLRIVTGTPNHLERNMSARLVVPAQPNRAEMTPAEFLNDRVLAVLERLSDLHRVISALDVVVCVFLLGGVRIVANGRRGR